MLLKRQNIKKTVDHLELKKKKNLIMGWLKRSDKGIQESQLNPCKQKEKKTP